MLRILTSFLFIHAAFIFVSGQTSGSFELNETSRLLGTTVKEFPAPQGLSSFDDISSGPPSNLKITRRPLTGPTPLPSYEKRETVSSTAPDGTIYEGWSGRFEESNLYPGPEKLASNINPRQRYGTHFGYGFNPADVFIGRRVSGKIRTSLFFRDVGSHETAPYYFTVDSTGLVHLIVADVNISDNNELNVYSVVGDPKTGKWMDAVMLDRRGFTSQSHPWAGKLGDTVHLLWNWSDETYDKNNPSMGLFYVDWHASGYGRKKRLAAGTVKSYDAAIDLKSGQMLVVVTIGYRIYLMIRMADGSWRRPSEILPRPDENYSYDVSARSLGGGRFVVRASGLSGSEWLVAVR